MDIRLKNIGIIKDSSIRLDGLTVITGANNSGKTTVGKVVYSLLDATSDLSKKAESDKCLYIMDTLNDIREKLSMTFKIKPFQYDGEQLFSNHSAIFSLLYDFDDVITPNSAQYPYIKEFSQKLRNELTEFDLSSIDENSQLFSSYIKLSIDNHIDIKALRKDIKSAIDVSIKAIDRMLSDIQSDPELIDYARESINQTLNIEFSKQIQPVKVDVDTSRIEISDGGKTVFAFDIQKNKIVNDKKPVFTNVSYNKIYFIDNPFVLDTFPYRRTSPNYFTNGRTILNTHRISTHEAKLNFTLRTNNQTTIFKETIINRGLEKIKAEIDEVVSGDFEFKANGEFYVKDGKKLHITNLATGLHPSWQNKFAEVIVLLVKYLNTQVLLTSHSPNFVLAIDAYMRKYDIIDKTNFYQTNCLDDGLVEYVNVNDDLGQIYSDFMRYLSEVKQLRDYYYNLGENHDS